MQGSDYLIIFFSLLIIIFLTLTFLCFIETSLKKKEWLKWGSLGGLVLTIIITGVLIWYYHGKGTNKKEEFKTAEEKAAEGKMTKGEINQEEDKMTDKDQMLINNLKKEK